MAETGSERWPKVGRLRGKRAHTFNKDNQIKCHMVIIIVIIMMMIYRIIILLIMIIINTRPSGEQGAFLVEEEPSLLFVLSRFVSLRPFCSPLLFGCSRTTALGLERSVHLHLLG